jgi:hypothetical protein
MSEEEVPAGPPAWPGGVGSNDPWGGTGWTSAPPPVSGWWPQSYYTYEPPPSPRRTSRLLMFGVAVVIFVFAASAAATAVIATRGFGGSGNTSGVQAAIVDIDTLLGNGAAAAGTGIVLTSAGVVLTNEHVVAGEQSISVRLTSTGATYPAIQIGGDSLHDIAVLQIQGVSGLATAPIGDSSSVQVGDSITAFGNAEGKDGPPAVATGTVTALGQSITASDDTGQGSENLTGMIQTNAPILPGDSGGPLVKRQWPGGRHRHRGKRWTPRPRPGVGPGVRDSDRYRLELRPSDPEESVGAAGRSAPRRLCRRQRVAARCTDRVGSGGRAPAAWSAARPRRRPDSPSVT